MRSKTAGKGWFDLPAPPESELPRLYREVEALRLRNQLDPKRFYKKDEGEGKGIKGLPKYFAVCIPWSLSFSDLNRMIRTDWNHFADDDAFRDSEQRQPYPRKPQTDIGGRARGRCGGQALRKKEVRGVANYSRREGPQHDPGQAEEAKMVEQRKASSMYVQPVTPLFH